VNDIPDIEVGTINDINIVIPSYIFNEINSIPNTPPVSLSIGLPIINIPGCVEFHPANKKSNKLKEEDDGATRVLCDGTVPSYTPIDYQPENLVYSKPADVPMIPLDNNEIVKPPSPELPSTSTPEIICPPIDAPIVGSIVEGNRRISGYEVQNGRCITLYEEVPIVEQIIDSLPTAGAVTTTASIALVATTSAVLAKPLADLVLKAIKPLIKTAMKKIQKLLGKNPRRLTYSETLSNLYREKKGLPALKVK
jgi:hypothetical protein